MSPKSRKNSPVSNRSGSAREFYATLRAAWGPQHWWPAESALEVIVGAYLTQNTAWRNVEQALANLRARNLLSVEALRALPVCELEPCIRPAGYFRQKSRALKAFLAFLDLRYEGSLERMFSQPTEELREELLGLKGVGPETADSILAYAGQHAVFVVDTYTRRVVERHGLLKANRSYEGIRAHFEQELKGVEASRSLPETTSGGSAHPPSAMSTAKRSQPAQVLNEMHALLVGVGKNYCWKAEPRCKECPLGRFLPK